jgi:hypothetical protein
MSRRRCQHGRDAQLKGIVQKAAAKRLPGGRG